MSYLLDALKESQQKRELGRGGHPFLDKAVDATRFDSNDSGDSRKYVYVAIVVVALGVLGGWFYAEINDAAPSPVAEVALPGGGEAVSTTVAAVEPEEPADSAVALARGLDTAPARDEAGAESRGLPGSDEIEALYSRKQAAVAGDVAALAVAADPGPVAIPESAPSHPVTSPVQAAPVAEPPGADVEDSSIPHFKTLPLDIQREIGPMDFSVHMYSRQTSRRFVSINGEKNREGDELKNGVHLDSIVSSGAIFSYKGYRFWIPMR